MCCHVVISPSRAAARQRKEPDGRLRRTEPVIGDYESFVKSFMDIADPRVKSKVEDEISAACCGRSRGSP
jgi:hypothetical protein